MQDVMMHLCATFGIIVFELLKVAQKRDRHKQIQTGHGNKLNTPCKCIVRQRGNLGARYDSTELD